MATVEPEAGCGLEAPSRGSEELPGFLGLQSEPLSCLISFGGWQSW